MNEARKKVLLAILVGVIVSNGVWLLPSPPKSTLDLQTDLVPVALFGACCVLLILEALILHHLHQKRAGVILLWILLGLPLLGGMLASLGIWALAGFGVIGFAWVIWSQTRIQHRFYHEIRAFGVAAVLGPFAAFLWPSLASCQQYPYNMAGIPIAFCGGYAISCWLGKRKSLRLQKYLAACLALFLIPGFNWLIAGYYDPVKSLEKRDPLMLRYTILSRPRMYDVSRLLAIACADGNIPAMTFLLDTGADPRDVPPSCVRTVQVKSLLDVYSSQQPDR